MLPPIPRLEDYSISRRNGFLPDLPPLRRLPDRYYEPWEEVVDNLQPLILTKRIRGVVNLLPILSISRLRTEAELRRAYSILCFISHSFIWGGDKPAQHLPACISVPLLRVSEALEVAPVASYAGLVLWNYRTLFGSQDVDILENLATLHTITGSLDESWFYLVSVAIEGRAAPVIPRMLEAIAAAREGDVHTVLRFLNFFAEVLEDITPLLLRIFENCDPHVFYFKIRPFLAGSKNMADAGLPYGVWYEDENGGGVWKQLSGGSNAQSSLIQAFDIILGIEHRPTGVRASSEDKHQQGITVPQKHNFIEEMRGYMPGPHRRFLEQLTSVANIRPFVEAYRSNHELCNAYDSCLAMLRGFRDKHIQVVSRYIIIQAKHAKKTNTETDPNDTTTAQKLNLASDEATKKGLTGTGGTALISFLKQARDETGEPAIGPVARRLLVPTSGKKSPAISGKVTAVLDHDVLSHKPAQTVGLAWYWFTSNDFGGLCSY